MHGRCFSEAVMFLGTSLVNCLSLSCLIWFYFLILQEMIFLCLSSIYYVTSLIMKFEKKIEMKQDSEAAAGGVLQEKVFLGISQN